MSRNESVSQVVRILLAHRNMRQSDLGAAIGMETSTISSRLTGRTRWTVDDLEAAAGVLGVPIEVLVRDPGELFAQGVTSRYLTPALLEAAA